MMLWSVVLLFGVLFQSCLGDLIVQTDNGRVEGTSYVAPNGQTFYAWRGIPYAKAPIGDLRFLAPQKAEPWTDVRDASNDSPACVSFIVYPTDPVPLNGKSEDCLYINVYSPVPVGTNSSIEPTLPVMVWIYGGGFAGGFSDFGFYDPTAFLEENVIVVSFNYRLGPLGFLSTEDEVVPGNSGLKDQVLALQWTQNNIASFGGNPSQVTIFGESAGGMSVGGHIISPLSRNLFKAAIMQSGSALLSVQSGAKTSAYTLANAIDSSITGANTTGQVLEVLQKADVDLILKAAPYGVATGMVLEPKSDTAFLSAPLYEEIEAGNISLVPTIIGHNSEELIGSLYDINQTTSMASIYDYYLEGLVPNINLKENVSKAALGQEIHQMYLGNGTFAENVAIFLEWQSDNTFVRNIHKHAILQSKYTPVYMYQFSYYGTLSKSHLVIPGAGKVAHAEEVGYLFNISNHILQTDDDYITRKRFVKLWTNFAKTSNPTPDDESSELLENVKWEPITEDNRQYLDIDNDLQMKPDRKVKETEFWDYLWSTYSYRPYNTF